MTPSKIVLTIVISLAAIACGSGDASDSASAEAETSDGTSSTAVDDVTTAEAGTDDAADDVATSGPGSSTEGAVESGEGFFDSSVVHEIAVEFDERDYEAVIEAYVDSGDKDWLEATVTIDGQTYEQVGMRLKGNSSLAGLRGGGGGPSGSVSADDPTSLPWLIRLDEFVDGQSHDGITELVVRSNSSETALNEAVALDLLEAAGLASQDAVAVRFSVNSSEQRLRLVIENPGDEWMAEELSADGALYKAESTGDYSYRGDDPEAYDEVFDQEAGADNADLDPLIEFLEFINDADDETFAAELAAHLDVEAFARYLAIEDLMDNFDDIDGPGNNSYLYYDTDTERFTVVAWDHNLAFGGFGGGGPGGPGAGGFPGGAELPDGIDIDELPAPPGGAQFPGGAQQGGPGGGGFGGRSNILVERFLAVDEFSVLYDAALADLTEQLYDSGVAADVLDSWVEVLTDGASDLVDPATVESEAERVAGYFS